MATHATILPIILLFTTLSGAALAKWDKHHHKKPHQRPDFSFFDLNTSGDIDFDEFSSRKLPRGDHQTIFNHMDTDNNGLISHDEFEQHKPPRRKKCKEGKVRQIDIS